MSAKSDNQLSEHCWMLSGSTSGRYPDANALLVIGSEQTALIDAPLCLFEADVRDSVPDHDPDLVVLSHAHEDHFPGLDLDSLREKPLWVHAADRAAMQSLEQLLDLFGMPEPRRTEWSRVLLERFRFRPRPDVRSFEDGHVWNLGDVAVRAIHTPGHTGGHCAFRIHAEGDPDDGSEDIVFLADIDLSSFGPYYGDAASSLLDFERTVDQLHGWRAQWFVTGHHLGAVEQSVFDARLVRYRQRFDEREAKLLDYLHRPRSMQELVAHRFIYRPHDQVAGADWIEERSAGQHLERLVAAGKAELLAGAEQRWQAV